MKKEYQKPALSIERFLISQTIANGCGLDPNGSSLGDANHWDKLTCGWIMGNQSIWVEENNGCKIKFDADYEYKGVCYNNPNGSNTIFSS